MKSMQYEQPGAINPAEGASGPQGQETEEQEGGRKASDRASFEQLREFHAKEKEAKELCEKAIPELIKIMKDVYGRLGDEKSLGENYARSMKKDGPSPNDRASSSAASLARQMLIKAQLAGTLDDMEFKLSRNKRNDLFELATTIPTEGFGDMLERDGMDEQFHQELAQIKSLLKTTYAAINETHRLNQKTFG